MVRKIKVINPELEFIEIPYQESDFQEETDPHEIEKAHQELKKEMRLWKKRQPYLKKMQQREEWKTINATIEELVHKEDIIETTARDCIVNFIFNALARHRLIRK